MTEWIPVIEQRPKDGQDVLGYVHDGEETRVVPMNYYKGEWFDYIFDTTDDNVTHWMPIPDPPKE